MNLVRNTRDKLEFTTVCFTYLQLLLCRAYDAVESCWLLLIWAVTLGFAVEKTSDKFVRELWVYLAAIVRQEHDTVLHQGDTV